MSNPIDDTYDKIEAALEPMQPYVIVMMILLAASIIWAIFFASPAVRTGWFLWLILP